MAVTFSSLHLRWVHAGALLSTALRPVHAECALLCARCRQGQAPQTGPQLPQEQVLVVVLLTTDLWAGARPSTRACVVLSALF